MTVWTTLKKLSLQKIDARFWKETNIHYREKKQAFGEDRQKSVSTSEAPWRETVLSEGHKHPSWNVEENKKRKINRSHHHSASALTSSHLPRTGCLQELHEQHPTPFFPRHEQRAALFPSKSSLVHFATTKTSSTAPSPTGHKDAASWWWLTECGNALRWQETPQHLWAEQVPVTFQTIKGGKSDKGLPAKIPITHHRQNSSQQNLASVISVKWQTS